VLSKFPKNTEYRLFLWSDKIKFTGSLLPPPPRDSETFIEVSWEGRKPH
jgi:hypothetical protein